MTATGDCTGTSARTVPIYQLQFEPEFVERFQLGCAEIFSSDSISDGRYVGEFEQLFASYVDTNHAIATNSGTAAIECALRAVDVQGKRVVIPANTFIATAIAVERAGGIVVLADIEDKTFGLDASLLDNLIDAEVGAVVLVHVGGTVSTDVSGIVELCERYGVPIIEDAAQAHGSRRGRFVAGSIGAAACFSFFPTKVMTTAEGGMVTTNDPVIADRVRSIKNFGRDSQNPLLSVMSGANFKMTEFQGLMGVLEMDRVDSRISKRAELASKYRRDLKGGPFTPINPGEDPNSYYKQIVLTNINNDLIRRFCREKGVSLTGEVYKVPVHQQPIYKKHFDGNLFPISNWFSQHHICPPVYPELNSQDVEYVCEILCEAAISFD